MASFFNLLSLILLLSLVFKADGNGCLTKDISIGQSKTGRWVDGMPEWKVTITNKCSCLQYHVEIYCDGFQTKEVVDPSILIPYGGGVCLVKIGKAIAPSETVEFLYAWNPQFSFRPLASIVECR